MKGIRVFIGHKLFLWGHRVLPDTTIVINAKIQGGLIVDGENGLFIGNTITFTPPPEAAITVPFRNQ